jgi:sec-independent protein translocase protein TatB
MFGIGTGELVIILVLALILLGPQRLPDAAKQIGKGLREFRKATEDLKQQFESELYSTDDKPKPTLVPPAAGAVAGSEAAAMIPPGGVPAQPAGEVPHATAENVPGLDAALVEVRPPTPAPAPAADEVAKAS